MEFESSLFILSILFGSGWLYSIFSPPYSIHRIAPDEHSVRSRGIFVLSSYKLSEQDRQFKAGRIVLQPRGYFGFKPPKKVKFEALCTTLKGEKLRQCVGM